MYFILVVIVDEVLVDFYSLFFQWLNMMIDDENDGIRSNIHTCCNLSTRDSYFRNYFDFKISPIGRLFQTHCGSFVIEIGPRQKIAQSKECRKDPAMDRYRVDDDSNKE